MAGPKRPGERAGPPTRRTPPDPAPRSSARGSPQGGGGPAEIPGSWGAYAVWSARLRSALAPATLSGVAGSAAPQRTGGTGARPSSRARSRGQSRGSLPFPGAAGAWGSRALGAQGRPTGARAGPPSLPGVLAAPGCVVPPGTESACGGAGGRREGRVRGRSEETLRGSSLPRLRGEESGRASPAPDEVAEW